MKKLELPHDSMTSPRYIDAQRKINEMKPLKERTANVSICLYHQDYLNTISREKKKLLKLQSGPYNTPSNTIAGARADFSKLLSIT